VNIFPKEQSSPLGSNFTPWGRLMLLKTGLWCQNNAQILYIFINNIRNFYCIFKEISAGLSIVCVESDTLYSTQKDIFMPHCFTGKPENICNEST
jgi:hypothetical protein